MPNLQADNIADMIALTLKQLGKGKWTDIATDTVEHVFLPQMLKKEKVQYGSGTGIQWNVMVRTSGQARHVGLFATDEVNVTDVMKQANIPWRHTTVPYAFDEHEFDMNSDDSQILGLVKTRRSDAMIDLAEKLENTGWSKPDDSSDDVTPFGIPYYVVKNATTGFTGGNPTGFTSGAANLSSATYPRWSNYSATYTAVNKSDFIASLRTAARKTGFKSPIDIPTYARGADRYGWYTNDTVLNQLELAAEAQNDNLGNDVGSMDGKTMFHRRPITYVSKLDSDTTNPFYGINWSLFYPVVLKNWFLKETGPRPSPKQHNVKEVHIDLTWNLCCRDRRRQLVLWNNS